MQKEENTSFDKKKTYMVKCIAIIFMLMHHLFGCSVKQWMQYGGQTKWVSIEWFVKFCMQMKVCVGMFVFLTAFGITRSYRNNINMNRSVIARDSIKRYLNLEFDFGFVFILALATSFLRPGGLKSIYSENWRGGGYMMVDLLGLADYFKLPSQNETWWYMPYAFFLIFFVPALLLLYRNIGVNLVVIAVFINYFGINSVYLFCVVCGIWCAEEDILEKINSIGFQFLNRKINTMIKIFCEIVLIIIGFYLRSLGWGYYIDAIFTITIAELCMKIAESFSVIERAMVFIGKHSTNIFLIHTIIFEYYFPGFIYGMKYWPCVLLILLSICLALSIAIEHSKNLIKFGLLKQI